MANVYIVPIWITVAVRPVEARYQRFSLVVQTLGMEGKQNLLFGIVEMNICRLHCEDYCLPRSSEAANALRAGGDLNGHLVLLVIKQSDFSLKNSNRIAYSTGLLRDSI